MVYFPDALTIGGLFLRNGAQRGTKQLRVGVAHDYGAAEVAQAPGRLAGLGAGRGHVSEADDGIGAFAVYVVEDRVEGDEVGVEVGDQGEKQSAYPPAISEATSAAVRGSRVGIPRVKRRTKPAPEKRGA